MVRNKNVAVRGKSTPTEKKHRQIRNHFWNLTKNFRLLRRTMVYRSNCGGTVWNFKKLLSKTLSTKKNLLPPTKEANKKMTILACCNASGNSKIKLPYLKTKIDFPPSKLHKKPQDRFQFCIIAKKVRGWTHRNFSEVVLFTKPIPSIKFF